jgi:hypothetical protein
MQPDDGLQQRMTPASEVQGGGSVTRRLQVNVTGPAAQALDPKELAKALRQAERRNSNRKLGRRALLGVAGLGVCAGAVEFGPGLLKKGAEFTAAEVADAFNSGVQAGKSALLHELTQLKDVGLDAAITAAELTKFLADHFIIPLSELGVQIEGDALQVLVNALATARSDLSRIGVSVPWLNNLEETIAGWENNLPNPDDLKRYVDQDIVSAEKYLRYLKAAVVQEQSSKVTLPTPAAPNPTSGVTIPTETP